MARTPGKYHCNFSLGAESSRLPSGDIRVTIFTVHPYYRFLLFSLEGRSNGAETASIIARFGRDYFARCVSPLKTAAVHRDTSESYIRARPEVAHPPPLIRIKFITRCNFRGGGNGCRCRGVRVVKLSLYIIAEPWWQLKFSQP